jgi:hypothetical protein
MRFFSLSSYPLLVELTESSLYVPCQLHSCQSGSEKDLQSSVSSVKTLPLPNPSASPQHLTSPPGLISWPAQETRDTDNQTLQHPAPKWPSHTHVWPRALGSLLSSTRKIPFNLKRFLNLTFLFLISLSGFYPLLYIRIAWKAYLKN